MVNGNAAWRLLQSKQISSSSQGKDTRHKHLHLVPVTLKLHLMSAAMSLRLPPGCATCGWFPISGPLYLAGLVTWLLQTEPGSTHCQNKGLILPNRCWVCTDKQSVITPQAPMQHS